MNKDELGGKIDNLKGRTKEAAGAVTGNKKTQGEGMVERVAGAVRENVGKAEEEVKQGADRSRRREEPDDDE
jgi:uncharacterized protein YjbJ (UPF0337 family)